jgi:F-type H+-transporting ATPase subunit epsilon
MAEMHVELVSPERILYSGSAEQVIARTAGGDIAFLPGHAPFLGTLGIGLVKIRTTTGVEEIAAVHGGFVEVSSNSVTILSQIDVDRAREAAERAEATLRTEHDAEVEAALRRAHVRLAAAGVPVG